MDPNPQLARYKKLLAYLEQNLHEEINIRKVEDICHYSYRNINRIFEAIHQETIGKYVKRLRLEKAAQYLTYSNLAVSQIAYEVGFEDRSAFSKAFKKKYDCSPQAFRENKEALLEEERKTLLPEDDRERPTLEFKVEYLPEFYSLFLEYRGDYADTAASDKVWEQLFTYASEKNLLSDQSILMTEIIDDAEISDHIHSRYNHALALEKSLDFAPEGLFRTKHHPRQKYVKFTHQGSPMSSVDYYRQIYTFWMLDVGLELVDGPILEFYPNLDENLPENELITEIYIPVG